MDVGNQAKTWRSFRSLPQSSCSRKLDGQEQSRKDGPGAEGYLSREPQVPSNGQNYKPLYDHSIKH